MANQAYRRFVQETISGNTDPSGDIYVYLVATTGVGTPYTFDQDHEFLSSIDASARIAATPNALANKTFSNGLLDGDDATAANSNAIASVSTDWQAIVIVLRAGASEAPANDRLVDYKDTGFTPPSANGSDVEVSFPSGITNFYG